MTIAEGPVPAQPVVHTPGEGAQPPEAPVTATVHAEVDVTFEPQVGPCTINVLRDGTVMAVRTVAAGSAMSLYTDPNPVPGATHVYDVQVIRPLGSASASS